MAGEALHLARSAGAGSLTGRCWFRLCGALVGVGDSAAALEAGREFLAGLDAGEWPDLVHLRGRCQSNIGMAYKARRQFPDAMEQLTHALAAFTHIPLSDGQTDLRGIVKARHLLAWMLTDLDRAAEAEVHLEAARELIPLMSDWAEHQQAHTAYLRLRQRRRGEAALCAMELLAPDRPDVSAANRAIGHYVMGCVLLEGGDPEGAQRHCTLGQSLAAASEVPAVMNLLMDLVRKLRAPA
jgi:tetratricopeptide (TPR) repeat protein